MNSDEKELLAQFHHTISEQLNSRLSESPKFFGLLIVVSTGYGYVLSNPEFCKQKELVILASLLAYVTVLWASWYLAALGYAFRFLQNSQHCIEHALGWNPNYVPSSEDGTPTGKPPDGGLSNTFWLLPGIYHANAAGLVASLGIICLAFVFNMKDSCSHVWLGLTTFIATSSGLGLILKMNWYYFVKYRKKWRDPTIVIDAGN